MLIGLGAGLVVGSGTAAAAQAGVAANPDLAANPYQGIVVRNLFGLKDPPPPPAPPSEEKPQPKGILNGVTRLANRKWAFFKFTPVASKPGEQVKEESYSLAEGEASGPVEVLQIDELAGLVRLTYLGKPMTLDFTNNAAKAVAAAPAPGGPGVPGGHPGVMPVPGVVNPVKPGFSQPGFSPNRPLRAGGGGMVQNPGGAGGFGQGGMPAMPGAPVAGMATPGMAVGQPQYGGAPLTREQSDLLMELYRDQSRTDPTIPPIPPTSLTAAIEQANNEAASANTTTQPRPTSTPVPSMPPVPGRSVPMPPMPPGNF